jgi:dihydroorotase
MPDLTYDLTDMTLPKREIDVLLKGGRVIDPAQGIDGIYDVGITRGKISLLEKNVKSLCYNIINCQDKLVVPGFVDAHLHCFPSSHMSVPPDAGGIYAGVPTLIDGGSAGYQNFSDFYDRYITQVATDVYALLHVHPVGQYAHGSGHHVHSEQWDPSIVKVQEYRILETVERYHDRIVGIKNRAIETFIEFKGPKGVEEQIELCNRCQLPYAVHIGEAHGEHLTDDQINDVTRALLELMRPGDVITHCYTGKRGRIFREDGLFDDLIKSAIQRGVLLDACNGRTNFNNKSFKLAMKHGYKPNIISSDYTWLGLDELRGHFCVNISRFLALGLSLNEVIAMTTINPAKAFGLADRKGTLQIGRPADISVLDNLTGEFTFVDSIGGESFTGTQLLSPFCTVREGRVYHVIHKPS